ncbi:MAG TPA: PVC-type heme-binding CxxCH protein [Pirellulales bacterium]|nr:PVC-type heme-binding CxxCH protein [Pirellulales bacterium]
MPARLARALSISASVAALALLSPFCISADLPDEAQIKAELPRIAPHEPAAALSTFRVQPGYKIEQVAAEPLVVDPVCLAFDENSRLYAVEMRDYSEQDKEKLGRVRLLEDTDGDGRYDKSTIFAEGLSWPTAIACYDGGVFVGAAPDIVYCKDTNGDGRADVQKTIYTGFGRSNVQGLLNTFTWTLDNRSQGATSSSGAEVRPAGDPKALPLVLRGRDFQFDPKTLKIEAVSGGGQYGLSFDDWGQKFVCSNSDHIQQVMYEDRYLARNPYLTPPSPRKSIAVDGPQAEIYRASPPEPWRVVRTRLRVSGAVPGVVEMGGRVSGYFTGASGITIYRGDAFPAAMRGVAVIGEACAGMLHRKTIEADGLQLIARRMDAKSEFVASTDIWFRPVETFNAPDGGLYIADLYREVIEHPASLPPIIKKHLDLTSRNRGRIYRVVPTDFKQRPLPKLGKLSTVELVALLAHENAWHRETAARLLYERQDTGAIGLLERLGSSPSPLGRMHALYVLDGQQALKADTLLVALANRDPHVRQHAVRLAERVKGGRDRLASKLCGMTDDDNLRVRYQLAFTLGAFDGPEERQALVRLARASADNVWMRLAIQSSLARGAGAALADLVGEPTKAKADLTPLLTALASQIGMQAKKEDVTDAVQAIDHLPAAQDALAGSLAVAMSEGSIKAGRPLSASVPESSRVARLLKARLASSARVAADEKQSPARRAAAARVLVLSPFSEVRGLLAELLNQRQPQEVQLAAVAALSRFADPGVASILLEGWSTFSPALRAAALDALVARPARIHALLDAVADGRISAAEIDPARLQLLATSLDPKIRARAESLLKSAKLGRRQDVVDSYRTALKLSGDAVHGKQIFQKICAACHKADGVGHEIGPNLATVKTRGAEFILLNVLDPSREVNPQYVNYLAVTDDGRSLTGMIAAETATSITLRRAEGASDTLLRINIEEMRSTGLSLMPEGLEKQIDPQGLADVIAYILSLK